VVIYKPFKDALLKKYIEYCSIAQDIKSKITREKMIQFISEVWYDSAIITKEMIIKSFQCSGIIYSPFQENE
jgi:hypothetical protein